MRIAVIGAGNVGATLGGRWAARGHAVTFGVREGSAVKGGTPAGSRVAPLAEAARDADVVVLATPWEAAPDALRHIGPLDGKVLIDVTNPVSPKVPFGPNIMLDEGPDGASAAERIAALVPHARVVKAFNTTGFNNMADPIYGDAPATMFVAGDDAEAKRIALELARDLGFDPVDAGALPRARELEHLAILWIALAMGGLGREIAFRLVRR
jgi:NADPH-dependent F420 reductase